MKSWANIANIPNGLTILRLVCGVLIILQFDSIIKYAYLGAAVILDMLDGYAARKLNQASKFGAILDPAVDKTFALMIFAFVYFSLHLPAHYIILFFTRDIFSVLAAGYVFLAESHKKLEVKARPFGKIVTNIQFLTILFLIIGNLFWIGASMYLLFAASLVSIVDYLLYFRRVKKK